MNQMQSPQNTMKTLFEALRAIGQVKTKNTETLPRLVNFGGGKFSRGCERPVQRRARRKKEEADRAKRYLGTNNPTTWHITIDSPDKSPVCA